MAPKTSLFTFYILGGFESPRHEPPPSREHRAGFRCGTLSDLGEFQPQHCHIMGVSLSGTSKWWCSCWLPFETAKPGHPHKKNRPISTRVHACSWSPQVFSTIPCGMPPGSLDAPHVDSTDCLALLFGPKTPYTRDRNGGTAPKTNKVCHERSSVR